MDAGSGFHKGFTDDDEDEDELGKTASSSLKEVAVRGRGKGNADDKVTSMRQKHSAMEQRRRSKINDRFQILRDLIPHSDMKRDRASFLSEVIEYVQFLLGKVQKYESSCQGLNQDCSKYMPCKNLHGSGHLLGVNDPSDVSNNGHTPSAFILSGEDLVPAAPLGLNGYQSLSESENVSCGVLNQATSVAMPSQPYTCGLGFSQSHQRLSPDSENAVSQSQADWLRSVGASADNLLDEQELIIDEGTISISNVYSQRLLNILTMALQKSGVDLSRANISVQIHLGKRAFSRPEANMMDLEVPPPVNQSTGELRVGSSGEEIEQASKRRRPDTSS